jgi:hypothetical protein
MPIYAKIEEGSIAARDSGWDGFDAAAALDEGFEPFDVPDAGWLQIADGGIVVVDPTDAILAAKTKEIEAELELAVDMHIDDVARARRYGTATMSPTAACLSYRDSAFPAFTADADAFEAWRTQVWLYCIAQADAVYSGQRTQPTIEELIAELPQMEWPS